MHPKTSLSAAVDGKWSRGRECQVVRDYKVENTNLKMCDAGKDSRIDK